MANTDAAFGFRLVDSTVGDPQGGLMEFDVDVANATAIFRGDPITALAGGTVQSSAANDGVTVIGIVQGCLDDEGKDVSFLAALTAGKVLVSPLKGRIYSVQGDTGTSILAIDIFATANFVIGAGDTGSGVSRYELDASDIGTGQQFRILGLSKDTRGNDFGEHAVVYGVFVEDALEDNTSI